MDRIETLNNSLLRTTNNGLQTLRSYPMPDQSTARTDLTVIGRATDGLSASWNVEVCCKRVAGAGVVLIEPNEGVLQARKDTGTSSWTVQVAANGNNLEIKVKGDATRNVDWQITGSIVIFAPPA